MKVFAIAIGFLHYRDGNLIMQLAPKVVTANSKAEAIGLIYPKAMADVQALNGFGLSLVAEEVPTQVLEKWAEEHVTSWLT